MDGLEDRTVPANISTTTIAPAIEPSGFGFGTTGYVRIVTDSPSSMPTIVTLSYTGSATNGTHFSATSSPTIPAYASYVDVPITPFGNTNATGTLTIVTKVEPDWFNTYTVGSPSVSTTNLYDDDTVQVTVSVQGGNPTEGGSSAFRITRSGSTSGDLTVNFATGGSATSGTDYTSLGTSATITSGNSYVDVAVGTLADNLVEGGESVSIQITDNGTSYSAYGDAAFVAMAINDDPPIINITAANVVEAGATGGFTATRSGGDPSVSLTMTYSVSGTADSEVDYAELPGSFEFPAGVLTGYIPIDAIGDNIADVDETVILTISGGGTDYIIGDDGGGTVIIGDQPTTVSVLRNADGVENGADPSFKFVRAGNISEELVVTYTVNGTATSAGSADFTALSGTVTFGENEDEAIVTVTLTNDSTVEPTEYLTASLVADGDYLIANPSATVMITDDDATTDVYWISTGSTDWTVASNWSINAVPGKSHLVHFWSSKSNVNCTNLGYGLSTVEFAGLFVEDSYAGTITLDEPLMAGTFRMTSECAAINQPHGDEDILVANSMYWTNGMLNTVDSGASVILDGAGVALIDPPDNGTIHTASTLEALGRLSLLPGELDFIGGAGLVIAGITNVITGKNEHVTVSGSVGGDKVITVESDGALFIGRKDITAKAQATSKLPIESSGSVIIESGTTFEVLGHVGGGQGPSFKVNKGSIVQLATSSTLINEFGIEISASGMFRAEVLSKGDTATVKGAFKLTGGSVSVVHDPDKVHYGILDVVGVVTWLEGTYTPSVDGTDAAKADLWIARRFNITDASLAFNFAAGTQSKAASDRRWKVLEGTTGVKNANNTANYPVPNITPTYPDFNMESNNISNIMWWQLHRLNTGD